jgi:hypothetical protein
MGKRGGWVLAAAVACAVAGRAEAAVPLATVLYLNFSDGQEDVVHAATDNAAQNRTVMGSAAPFPAFAWPGMNDQAARRDLVASLAQQVNDAFLPFNLVVTTTRPESGPYTMVVVGGGPALFSMDAHVAGVAYMDCDNRQPDNVVFAFPDALGGSEQALLTTIAQEAAHAFGLQHSADPDDLMYPRVDLAQRTFQDRETSVASPNLCGPQTQNSYRRLLEVLGPWTGGDKSVNQPVVAENPDPPPLEGGCALGGTRRGNGPVTLGMAAFCLVFAMRACRRRGRGL